MTTACSACGSPVPFAEWAIVDDERCPACIDTGASARVPLAAPRRLIRPNVPAWHGRGLVLERQAEPVPFGFVIVAFLALFAMLALILQDRGAYQHFTSSIDRLHR